MFLANIAAVPTDADKINSFYEEANVVPSSMPSNISSSSADSSADNADAFKVLYEKLFSKVLGRSALGNSGDGTLREEYIDDLYSEQLAKSLIEHVNINNLMAASGIE